MQSLLYEVKFEMVIYLRVFFVPYTIIKNTIIYSNFSGL